MLLCSGYPGHILAYDLSNGKPLPVSFGMSSSFLDRGGLRNTNLPHVCTLEISPDHQLVAAGGNPWIKMFEIRKPETLVTLFEGHSSNVVSIGFESSCSWFFSASEDKTIKIWDLRASGYQMNCMFSNPILGSTMHSNQAEIFSTGSSAGEIVIWDLHANRIRNINSGCRNQITSLSYNSQEVLVCSSVTGEVSCKKNSAQSFIGAELSSLSSFSVPGSSVDEEGVDRWGFDGASISPGVDGEGRDLWEVFPAHSERVLRCRLLSSAVTGRRNSGQVPTEIATTSSDGSCKIWRQAKKTIPFENTRSYCEYEEEESASERSKKKVAWVWDMREYRGFFNDRKFVTGSSDGYCRVWSMNKSRPDMEINCGERNLSAVTCLAIITLGDDYNSNFYK